MATVQGARPVAVATHSIFFNGRMKQLQSAAFLPSRLQVSPSFSLIFLLDLEPPRGGANFDITLCALQARLRRQVLVHQRRAAARPAASAAAAAPQQAGDYRQRPHKDVRVLVVGATGYIGKYVVRELVARGYSVVAFSREKSGIGGKASMEDTHKVRGGEGHAGLGGPGQGGADMEGAAREEQWPHFATAKGNNFFRGVAAAGAGGRGRAVWGCDGRGVAAAGGVPRPSGRGGLLPRQQDGCALCLFWQSVCGRASLRSAHAAAGASPGR